MMPGLNQARGGLGDFFSSFGPNLYSTTVQFVRVRCHTHLEQVFHTLFGECLPVGHNHLTDVSRNGQLRNPDARSLSDSWGVSLRL